ncbi:Hypothetical predicted protein [Olea europaea subsp. europaea]|uniref:Uncharacterized protein n=1 Tax=Olea europaea subsp. europaea TaxID=158383 RepID=A0A8S0UYI7_OLEEU|nr:Hypothetical predicted protein [Olea europaea subsp. europaea]
MELAEIGACRSGGVKVLGMVVDAVFYGHRLRQESTMRRNKSVLQLGAMVVMDSVCDQVLWWNWIRIEYGVEVV